MRTEGIDTKKPDGIKIGMPLKVKYLYRGDGLDSRTYLEFEPIL